MNVNPMQLIQLITGGYNPQQLMMSVLQQQGGSNPILQNALGMAQNNNLSGLEVLARNLAAQRGLNYEEAFAQFMSNFK